MCHNNHLLYNKEILIFVIVPKLSILVKDNVLNYKMSIFFKEIFNDFTRLLEIYASLFKLTIKIPQLYYHHSAHIQSHIFHPRYDKKKIVKEISNQKVQKSLNKGYYSILNHFSKDLIYIQTLLYFSRKIG